MPLASVTLQRRDKVIIKYVITGYIQLEGENPQEAVRELTPLALQNQGFLKETKFEIDGKCIATWAEYAPLPFGDEK